MEKKVDKGWYFEWTHPKFTKPDYPSKGVTICDHDYESAKAKFEKEQEARVDYSPGVCPEDTDDWEDT